MGIFGESIDCSRPQESQSARDCQRCLCNVDSSGNKDTDEMVGSQQKEPENCLNPQKLAKSTMYKCDATCSIQVWFEHLPVLFAFCCQVVDLRKGLDPPHGCWLSLFDQLLFRTCILETGIHVAIKIWI